LRNEQRRPRPIFYKGGKKGVQLAYKRSKKKKKGFRNPIVFFFAYKEGEKKEKSFLTPRGEEKKADQGVTGHRTTKWERKKEDVAVFREKRDARLKYQGDIIVLPGEKGKNRKQTPYERD